MEIACGSGIRLAALASLIGGLFSVQQQSTSARSYSFLGLSVVLVDQAFALSTIPFWNMFTLDWINFCGILNLTKHAIGRLYCKTKNMLNKSRV